MFPLDGCGRSGSINETLYWVQAMLTRSKNEVSAELRDVALLSEELRVLQGTLL